MCTCFVKVNDLKKTGELTPSHSSFRKIFRLRRAWKSWFSKNHRLAHHFLAHLFYLCPAQIEGYETRNTRSIANDLTMSSWFSIYPRFDFENLGAQIRDFRGVYIKCLYLAFYFDEKYCLSSEKELLIVENASKIRVWAKYRFARYQYRWYTYT